MKAIRHYHEIGLLDEPERTTNGYKQYQAVHLVRLLRITRLTDLDVPLSQVKVMAHADAEPEQAHRVLDAELAASIDRLSRVRAELALIFQQHSSADLPAGFGPVDADLSEADRALILIYSRVFGPDEMNDLSAMMIEMGPDPVHREFDSLPPDADDATRQELAEKYAPGLRRISTLYPWMKDPGSRALRGPTFLSETVGQAISELYNPAQLDVLQRATRIVLSDSAP